MVPFLDSLGDMANKRYFQRFFQNNVLFLELLIVKEICQRNDHFFQSDLKRTSFTRNADSLREMAKKDFLTKRTILLK